MVSSEAKQEIERLFLMRSPVDAPLAERRQGWEEQMALEPLPPEVRFTQVSAGGVAAEWMEAPGLDPARVFLLLHGGGYNSGSPRTHRKLAAQLGLASRMRVLTPEYRLAPEHPFPAGVEDAIAAYEWLLANGCRPDEVIVGGDSAGGGLALSMLLMLRQAGRPLPRAAVLMAPWTDLTVSSPSYEDNRWLDPIIDHGRLRAAGRWYAGDGDPANPMASPLFADLKGLPPLLIHAGGDEAMVDDSRFFAQRARTAGVEVTEKIWPGLWHVFHTAAPHVPEAREAIAEIGAFVAAQFSAPSSKQGTVVR